jgi:hypothetical protein
MTAQMCETGTKDIGSTYDNQRSVQAVSLTRNFSGSCLLEDIFE